MNPWVSIIVPTYNRAHFILDCVDSVVAQTYRPLELIIVDDGSTDETESIIRERMARLANEEAFSIRYFKTENRGAPHARNYGFGVSKGEYVVFLDSDDMLMAEKVEEQVRFLEEGQYDLVYCRNQRIYPDEKLVKRWSGRKMSHDSKDYFYHSWQSMCALYHRDYIDKIGPWDEELPIGQDWDFCLRAILAGGKIGFQDKALQLYRYHHTGRIGDDLDFKRARGREIGYVKMYERLLVQKKTDPWVRKKYRSSLLHTAFFYGANSHSSERDHLLKDMKRLALLSTKDIVLWRFLSMKWFARTIMFIHRHITLARKRIKKSFTSH